MASSDNKLSRNTSLDRGISDIQRESGVDWSIITAGTLLAVAPLLVAFCCSSVNLCNRLCTQELNDFKQFSDIYARVGGFYINSKYH